MDAPRAAPSGIETFNEVFRFFGENQYPRRISGTAEFFLPPMNQSRKRCCAGQCREYQLAGRVTVPDILPVLRVPSAEGEADNVAGAPCSGVPGLGFYGKFLASHPKH